MSVETERSLSWTDEIHEDDISELPIENIFLLWEQLSASRHWPNKEAAQPAKFPFSYKRSDEMYRKLMDEWQEDAYVFEIYLENTVTDFYTVSVHGFTTIVDTASIVLEAHDRHCTELIVAEDDESEMAREARDYVDRMVSIGFHYEPLCEIAEADPTMVKLDVVPAV